MKLVGELKEKVEKTESREEARNTIREAGIELTEEEMEQVVGGQFRHLPSPIGSTKKM